MNLVATAPYLNFLNDGVCISFPALMTSGGTLTGINPINLVIEGDILYFTEISLNKGSGYSPSAKITRVYGIK